MDVMNVGLDIPNLPMLPHQIFNHQSQQPDNVVMLPHQIFNVHRQHPNNLVSSEDVTPDNVLMLPQPDNVVMLPHQIFSVHRQQPNNLVSSEDGRATSLPQNRNHRATSLPQNRNHWAASLPQNRNHHCRIRVRRRLDFDNIPPYEQLLELQERIGNVNTGLSEENITNCLKTRTVTFGDVKDEKIFNETCIVCQDEYKDNDTIGTLKCGHEYHRDCIKEWLVLKNVCPICKRPALSTTMPIN